MIGPCRTKNPNIIHVKFDAFNVIQNGMHHFSRNVRGFANAHGQATVVVEPEWCGKGTKVL